MKIRQERLSGKAAVKGTMLQSRVSWINRNIAGGIGEIEPYLEFGDRALLTRSFIPATEWVPFQHLIRIDRAIAAAAGGPPERVYQDLGRHSASLNLGGAYRLFTTEEPHRFFENMALLHNRFQNFGRSMYGRVSRFSGRIELQDYFEYSPVFCTSALGYYEEALRIMNAAGPIIVTETLCQCAGDTMCQYELKWH